MDLILSEHAQKRMKQRAITQLQIEHILKYPISIKKALDKKEAIGIFEGRNIKIVYVQKENYIKIVTVM